MPLYDYACAACELTFEVSRSFADADVPADCPMCDKPAKRQLSVPMATFTRGAAADNARSRPGASEKRWAGGHGHSHAPGTAPHSH